MENQFKAVGMLINDLRRERFLLTENIIEDLQDDFREILLQLAYAWYQKVAWLEYLLDFHKAEAERLRSFVVHEDGRDYPSIRACLYEEFTAIMARLDLMIRDEYELY